MRVSPTAAAPALAAVLLCALGACSLPEAESSDATTAPAVDLSFSYQAVGGEGFIDQTLVITNRGAAAAAPDLDIVPLDSSGAELDGVTVVTAYGSDEGGQVVPAYTEVTDVLKFKGADADEVADVRVDVADPGTLDEEVPPANDLRVRRYDVDGAKTTGGTLGAVKVRNTYDTAITVTVVGIQYAPALEGEPMHFRQVSTLGGPVEIEPGGKVRLTVPVMLQRRFFGTVKAYLSS